MVASISSRVSDVFLKMIMKDQRVPLLYEALEKNITDNLNVISDTPTAVWKLFFWGRRSRRLAPTSATRR